MLFLLLPSGEQTLLGAFFELVLQPVGSSAHVWRHQIGVRRNALLRLFSLRLLSSALGRHDSPLSN